MKRRRFYFDILKVLVNIWKIMIIYFQENYQLKDEEIFNNISEFRGKIYDKICKFYKENLQNLETHLIARLKNKIK